MKIPPLVSRLSMLSAVLLLAAAPALAERADRDKPMNVEADALRYDDKEQTSVFTGRVVVTKGTILIRGARLDVRQDAAGNQFGVLRSEPGKLAFFRQKRDTRPGAPDEFIEGEGEVIEYDSKSDTVKFTGKAVVRRYTGSQLNDEITGNVIVFDNITSVMTVDGGPARAGADGSGRVRAMFSPRNGEAATPSPPAGAAPGPALRRSGSVGGDKK